MPRVTPTRELGLPAPDDPKAARFHAVADAVVRQLLVRGPEDLRYADIARGAVVEPDRSPTVLAPPCGRGVIAAPAAWPAARGRGSARLVSAGPG